MPEGERTQTARCVTDCRVLSLGEAQLKQLYFQNPKFGWYLVQLIAERLSKNARRLEEKRASLSPPAAMDQPVGIQRKKYAVRYEDR